MFKELINLLRAMNQPVTFYLHLKHQEMLKKHLECVYTLYVVQFCFQGIQVIPLLKILQE